VETHSVKEGTNVIMERMGAATREVCSRKYSWMKLTVWKNNLHSCIHKSSISDHLFLSHKALTKDISTQNCVQ